MTRLRDATPIEVYRASLPPHEMCARTPFGARMQARMAPASALAGPFYDIFRGLSSIFSDRRIRCLSGHSIENVLLSYRCFGAMTKLPANCAQVETLT